MAFFHSSRNKLTLAEPLLQELTEIKARSVARTIALEIRLSFMPEVYELPLTNKDTEIPDYQERI